MATPVSSPGFDAPNDTTLARALADCSRCLGTYLLALDRAPHAMTCPGCASVWSVSHAERPVDVPADLEALARWLPTICGRAVTYGGVGGGAPRHGERPDAVDERHRDRRSGLRTALGALSMLDAMERAGEARHVRVLWYAYVLCGPVQVKQHPGGLDDLIAERFTSRQQLAAWRTHKSRAVRETQLRAHGARILAGARAAYERATRFPNVAVASEPSNDHRSLSHALDELMARTLAKRVASTRPEVANDLAKVASEVVPKTRIASAHSV